MRSSPTDSIRDQILRAASVACLLAACGNHEPPPASRPVDAAAAPAAEVKPDAGRSDHLGMMERHALWKAKKEADAKLAEQLAAEERAGLIKFDRARLPKHAALLAFTKKTRAQLDAAAAKAKGQPNGAAQLEKLVASQHKAIVAQGKMLAAMDPKGGQSNIANDHDVTLQLLSNDYPAALVASLKGDDKPLADVRTELDKRQAKIEAWLAEIKKAKK